MQAIQQSANAAGVSQPLRFDAKRAIRFSIVGATLHGPYFNYGYRQAAILHCSICLARCFCEYLEDDLCVVPLQAH
eukprot:jgi/Chlat1/2688/Chrsp180S08750